MANKMANNETIQEIVNDGIEYVDFSEVVANDGNGIGTGAAIAIGVGLAAAGFAAVKLGRKLIAHIKAKKALRKPEKETYVEPEDLEEVAAK